MSTKINPKVAHHIDTSAARAANMKCKTWWHHLQWCERQYARQYATRGSKWLTFL